MFGEFTITMAENGFILKIFGPHSSQSSQVICTTIDDAIGKLKEWANQCAGVQGK